MKIPHPARTAPTLATLAALVALHPHAAALEAAPADPTERRTAALDGAAVPTGSLVFIRDHDVWVARADGTGQRPVTRDGTGASPYWSPSQSDDGTIAAARGHEVVVMRQDGEVVRRFDPPALDGSAGQPLDGAPVDVALSPDGQRIAYTFLNWQCPVGTSCGARQATAVTDVDRMSPASRYGQTYLRQPSWVGSTRMLQSGGYGNHVVLKDLGEAPVHWFDDEDVAESSTDLGDAELSPDGRRLAAVRGYGPDAHVTWYVVNGDARSGPPPAAPRWDCGTSTLAGLNNPTWAPDGGSFAFGSPEGVYVVRDLDSCGDPVLLLEDADEPDWSAAGLADAPTRLVNESQPQVSGTARVGRVLRATSGTWSPAPDRVTYQWLRDGRVVRGATSATYRLRDGDVGRTLAVRVTARAGCCEPVAATSDATKQVRR